MTRMPPEPAEVARDAASRRAFDGVVFAAGGCRCFWQGGFWSVVAPALALSPRFVGAASAGSALACAAFAGVLEEVLDDFMARVARNPRNVHLAGWRTGTPIFPHEAIYRATLLRFLDGPRLAALQEGPEIRVLLARPPAWLGARSGLAVGVLAYELDRWAGRGLHGGWGRRLGFRGEVVSVSACRTPEELAALILQSSCTPPLTPLYRRDGAVVLDGGLVDGVPVHVIPEARNVLVLLNRRHSELELPRVPGRTYVQPSRPVPVDKWDYTRPDRVLETWELGRRDAEAFLRASAGSRSIGPLRAHRTGAEGLAHAG